MRPPPIDDGPFDDAVECLAKVKLKRFTASGASFGGQATIVWETEMPSDCAGIRFEIDHQRVGPSGEMTVSPSRTRTYTLSAIPFGAQTGTVLGNATVAAGTIVGHSQVNGEWVTTPHPATHDAAASAAKEIFNRLDEAHRRCLFGKVIELHLIPFGARLTDLPPWEHLSGNTKGGTPWDDAEGAGGRLREDGRIVMAVAEKEIIDLGSDCHEYPVGYIMAHEMAHTILGTPTNGSFRRHTVFEEDLDRLRDAFDERVDAGGPFLPGVAILGGNMDFEEYWAEGTAAFFEYPWDANDAAMYTPGWLEQNDEPLFDLLQSVY